MLKKGPSIINEYKDELEDLNKEEVRLELEKKSLSSQWSEKSPQALRLRVVKVAQEETRENIRYYSSLIENT